MGFAFVSCTKDTTLVQPIDVEINSNSSAYKQKVIKVHELAGFNKTNEATNRSIGPNDDGCRYEECDTAIPYWTEQYQDLANELCQDIWIEIACCMDNQIAYAIIIIRPTILCPQHEPELLEDCC